MSAAADNEFILKRFGRYLLLDHLVNGGMAKICRARYLDEKASKIVAIKMIQSKYSDDEAFIRMFMDEVKVSFGLIHPNIAQTYDTGMVNNQLYTVMEYVDGKNLKQFIDKLKQKKFVFPVDISIHIISQVCQGLNYAHNFTDKLTGQKIHIIHRDISPHNIMLTYDGAVKVIDFGIAKAETNSDSTQAGTIKGKLSYLAPEYIEGYELDHRYDQFAVGITLWEMLCGRKLFNAGNDIAILKEIQRCKIPAPSTINPNVSKELDDIVLKALSKDRNLRYANMEQFNRALVKYLYAQFPDFNANDVSHFGLELFKDMIKKDKAKLVELGKIDIAPYIKDFNRESDNGQATVASKDDRQREAVLDFGFAKDNHNVTIKNAIKRPRPDLKKHFDFNNKEGSQHNVQNPLAKNEGAPKSEAALREEKAQEKISEKSQVRIQLKKQAMILNRFLYGGIITVALVGVFGVYTNLKQKLMPSQSKLRNPSSAAKGPMGMLKLLGLTPFQVIHLNDQIVTYQSIGIEVPMDIDVTLRVEEAGKYPYVTRFKVTSTNSTFTHTIPELKYFNFGELVSEGNYSPGTYLEFTLFEQTKKYDLPLVAPIRLPVGKYEGRVINNTLKISKVVQFEILEDRRVKFKD